MTQILFQSQVRALEKTLEGVVGQCNDLSADYNTLLTETNGLFTKVTAKLGCLLRDPDHCNRMHRYASMYGGVRHKHVGHCKGDCQSTIQSSVLMIPGKSSCNDSWTMQVIKN